MGGNLTLISTTLGHALLKVDTRGKIFFFEDVDEEPYRIGPYADPAAPGR